MARGARAQQSGVRSKSEKTKPCASFSFLEMRRHALLMLSYAEPVPDIYIFSGRNKPDSDECRFASHADAMRGGRDK